MVGAYHKIQIVSSASAKLYLIMELVHRLRNILRFSEVGENTRVQEDYDLLW